VDGSGDGEREADGGASSPLPVSTYPGGTEPVPPTSRVAGPGRPFIGRGYADRAEAGRVLAAEIARSAPLISPVVIALPRGGVPVAAEIARHFSAPLVVMPVAKIGAPGHEELAIGAVAAGGAQVLNESVLWSLRLAPGEVEALAAQAAAKVADQLQAYHDAQPPASLVGRSAVVVDDGLATGASMRAALVAVRRLGPADILLAVPVGPPSVLEELSGLADSCTCPLRPAHMQAVGSWYADFTQTTNAEVAELIAELGPGPTERS